MNLQRNFTLRVVTVSMVVALIPLGSTSVQAGSGIEAGPEIWVDGPDEEQLGSNRSFPDVAVDNNGTRIHVWNVFGAVSRGDIFLRRFDPEGNPLEDPRLVNTTTDDDQWLGRVAVSSDGSFLVIIESNQDHPIGADRDVVRSQAYDADGNTEGGEQLLSTLLPGTLSLNSDVAALRSSDGSAAGYVAVWASNESSGSDTDLGIEACLVSSLGVPSPQFQVPSDPDGTQTEPSVTELADGGFLVTWIESSQVWGRRFNNAGGGVGDDSLISTSFVAQKLENDAAIGWDGQVLVVWADQEDNGGTNAREIYARMFDADLNPLGPDFRVNTVLDDDQTEPRIADLGPQGFLVLWESQVASGPDTTGSIEARIVTGPNEFGGPQTQYNVWDNSGGQGPMGAHGWYGRATANWRTPTWEIEPGMVHNDDSIVGRDVEHCLFCDDFEWFHPGGPGSLWRWTSSAGLVP